MQDWFFQLSQLNVHITDKQKVYFGRENNTSK